MAAPTTPSSFSFWKMLLVAPFGILIGKLLADGVFPFQRVPFEDVGIPPIWAPWLCGLLVAAVVAWIVDFHAACASSAIATGRGFAWFGKWVARFLVARLKWACEETAAVASKVEKAAASIEAPLEAAAEEPAAAAATKQEAAARA